jgi:glycosyltransferase involved in cell wall biosynthesis
MDLSVIICTYNRSGHLKNVLKSLISQEFSRELRWEILVIDNNSTDDTFEVAAEFQEVSGVRIHYVKEKKQGLSYARNRGIHESKGKYIAFIDDDAVADSSWAESLYKAFLTYGCDGVGGRIYLKTEKKLPRWLTRDLWGFLACLDYGDKAFEVKDHYIYGTNMAFSRNILDIAGLFDTSLGRTGHKPIGGEETDLIKRILSSGGRIYYEPAAIVHHLVEDYKTSKQYFRLLHFYEGIWRGKKYDLEIKRHIFGVPLFVFLQFMISIVRYFRKPTVRMQMNIWWFLGFMKGLNIKFKG